jgi:hypothetical protein
MTTWMVCNMDMPHMFPKAVIIVTQIPALNLHMVQVIQQLDAGRIHHLNDMSCIMKGMQQITGMVDIPIQWLQDTGYPFSLGISWYESTTFQSDNELE